jgi:hypothetical protein
MFRRGAVAGGDFRTHFVNPMNTGKRVKRQETTSSSCRANRESDEPKCEFHAVCHGHGWPGHHVRRGGPRRHGRQAARRVRDQPCKQISRTTRSLCSRGLGRQTTPPGQQPVPMGLPAPSGGPQVDHSVRQRTLELLVLGAGLACAAQSTRPATPGRRATADLSLRSAVLPVQPGGDAPIDLLSSQRYTDGTCSLTAANCGSGDHRPS